MIQTGRPTQLMKCWFVTEKEQVVKRRALEVQTAQQSKNSLKPRPGGERGTALKREQQQQLGYAGLRKSRKPPKRGSGRLFS